MDLDMERQPQVKEEIKDKPGIADIVAAAADPTNKVEADPGRP